MLTSKTRMRLCFLPLIGVVILLILCAVSFHCSLENLLGAVESAKDYVASVGDDGEVGDVEGWGAIAYGVGGLLGALLYGAAELVLVWLPTAVAAVMGFGLLVARLVYAPQGVRLVLFRVQMVLLYLLCALTAALPLWAAFSVGGLMSIFKTGLFALCIAAAVLFSCIGVFQKPSAG